MKYSDMLNGKCAICKRSLRNYHGQVYMFGIPPFIMDLLCPFCNDWVSDMALIHGKQEYKGKFNA